MTISEPKINMEDSSWIDQIIKEHQKSKISIYNFFLHI